MTYISDSIAIALTALYTQNFMYSAFSVLTQLHPWAYYTAIALITCALIITCAFHRHYALHYKAYMLGINTSSIALNTYLCVYQFKTQYQLNITMQIIAAIFSSITMVINGMINLICMLICTMVNSLQKHQIV